MIQEENETSPHVTLYVVIISTKNKFNNKVFCSDYFSGPTDPMIFLTSTKNISGKTSSHVIHLQFKVSFDIINCVENLFNGNLKAINPSFQLSYLSIRLGKLS